MRSSRLPPQPSPSRPESIDEKALFHVPLRAADARRSVKNILEWNAYLPADCVKTMVRMGWDYTT